MAIKIAVVAGEASGDLLGADLLNSLRQFYPDMLAVGIGGDKMLAAGCHSLFSIAELSLMGIIEPLKRLPRLLYIRRTLHKFFLDYRPDVFIGIDAPDFNIHLALQLKLAGIPTVHYVSPSVWAWRQYRLNKIYRAIDLMLTLFPFEVSCYAQRNIPVQFVGHPLADQIPLGGLDQQAQRQALNLAPHIPIIALLPGSRRQELQQVAEVFFDAADLCQQQLPQVQFITSSSNAERDSQWRELHQHYAPRLPLQFFLQATQQVIAAADVVLVTSGTATLEAMLCQRPLVIAYRTAALNYCLAKMLVKIPFIGLPNLLAAKALVPEFIQTQATATNLATAVLAYFAQPQLVKQLQQQFKLLHQQLAQNASLQAATAIADLINSKNKTRANNSK
jgi:lipid-A-disaccharide synthase